MKLFIYSSLVYESAWDVPVYFNYENIPFLYSFEGKDVLNYLTDEYFLDFSIGASGSYNIEVINSNTGNVLKNYVINVISVRTEQTICIDSYEWLEIYVDIGLIIDKTDDIEVQWREDTVEEHWYYRFPDTPYLRTRRLYWVHSDKKGNCYITFYEKDKDHPYWIATYHIVDHDYRESSIIENASCTENGLIEKRCSYCGNALNEEIPATGHVWNDGYTVDIPVTCTEEGSESIHCSVCGEINEETVRVIPKAEHNYGDWRVAKEPNCTEVGSREKVCANCNDKVTESIPANGHTWEEEYTVDKEAACTEEGTESIHCTICGKIKEGSEHTIEKLPHTFGDWIIIKEATFYETGLMERRCSVCGENEQAIIERKKNIPVEGLGFDSNYYEIATKKTLQLTATVEPTNATDQSITWTSSDPSVATVSGTGRVKALKYGKVTITAKSSNGKTATCKIQTRFNDVNNTGKSYYIPVYWAVDKGITSCTVVFRPENNVTRGEFVTFLWRLAGKPKSSAKVNFKDVTSSTKFYDAIRWGVGKGIIKGYSDGTFKSDNPVTRGDTATMIWRYAGNKTPKTKKNPFSDVKASSADSYKAILWGSENGIIKGSGGKFLKNDTCTRGQVVTFLYRYKQKY